MGRINFYLHPDNYREFEDLLKATGDIIFLPYFHYDGKVQTVDTTIPVDFRKEGTRIYLVRQQDLKLMELDHIEKFGYWLIADNHLPVLHYDRCGFDNDKIIRGRLYFQPSFVKDMQWVNKSEDFVSWADNVIKIARRKLKKYKFDMGSWVFRNTLVNMQKNGWAKQKRKSK